MNALLIAGIVVLVVWYARRRVSPVKQRQRPTDDALTHALRPPDSRFI